jgi:hypothetical protein
VYLFIGKYLNVLKVCSNMALFLCFLKKNKKNKKKT